MPFFFKKNSFHAPFTPFPTKKHPFQKLKTSECPLRKNTPIKSIKTRLSPNFYFSQNFQVVSIFGSEENLWRKTETKTGGGCPRTSAYNSEILQSESLAEVSCPISSIIDPFLGRPNSHISNDAYKLKVEKLKFRVLGRAGGGAGIGDAK